MVCAVCVQTTLPALKASTKAAFSSLSVLQDTLDQTIDLGVKAEKQAINNYKNNVVSAVQADALTISTVLTKNSVEEERLLNSLKDSIEALAKSASVAKQNQDVAENYGIDNISHVTKAISNMQYADVIHKETEGNGTNGGNGQRSPKADYQYLIETVNSRKIEFTNEILKAEDDGSSILNMNTLFMGESSQRLKEDIVKEGDWNESIALRRFLAIPPGVQAGVRSIDLKDSDNSGYWRIAQRSRSAAEFLAWDLAIRSSINTEAGDTSLLHFLKSNIIGAYASTEGMIEDVTGGERTTLNTIAANESIANLLDMLLLKTNQYSAQLEAAKVGIYTDAEFNPVYGNNNIKSILNTVERGNDE